MGSEGQLHSVAACNKHGTMGTYSNLDPTGLLHWSPCIFFDVDYDMETAATVQAIWFNSYELIFSGDFANHKLCSLNNVSGGQLTTISPLYRLQNHPFTCPKYFFKERNEFLITGKNLNLLEF
jgi:hypothetical protein